MLEEFIRKVALETIDNNQYAEGDDIDEVTENRLIYMVAFNDGVLALMNNLLQETKKEPEPLGPS